MDWTSYFLGDGLPAQFLIISKSRAYSLLLLFLFATIGRTQKKKVTIYIYIGTIQYTILYYIATAAAAGGLPIQVLYFIPERLRG